MSSHLNADIGRRRSSRRTSVRIGPTFKMTGPHDGSGDNTFSNQRKFHHLVCVLTESSAFNGFIIGTICLNALCMALETEKSLKDSWGVTFDVLDYTFLFIYTAEFILKIYAEPREYWKSSYNLFDFLVLAISLVQTILHWTQGKDGGGLGALRVLRALRTLRTLRTVSFIRGLQVLVTALIDTIRKWVINILMLLMLLMFLFAIMGYYIFGYRDDGDKENWGSLGKAMLTLFSFVTVDGWTDLKQELDDRNIGGGALYSIIFIFLGHFIFTNVFIGVIIMNISEATDQYNREQEAERTAVLRHKKEFMMQRQHEDVMQLMERQRKGHYQNFHEMVSDFEKGLHHDDSVLTSDLCTNIIWMETFLKSLEHMDETAYRLQQLHFEVANNLGMVVESKLRKKYGL